MVYKILLKQRPLSFIKGNHTFSQDWFKGSSLKIFKALIKEKKSITLFILKEISRIL